MTNPTSSVSIDRASLGLSALVIAGARPATYFLAGPEALGRPAITRRATYADDHPYMDGSVLLSSVKEQSSLPLTVHVQAATSTALDAALNDLCDALDQFHFETTVTVNGVAKMWSCDPASYGSADGYISPIREAAIFEVLAITIPVYPIPGSA